MKISADEEEGCKAKKRASRKRDSDSDYENPVCKNQKGNFVQSLNSASDSSY
jgi:hypothetical protein